MDITVNGIDVEIYQTAQRREGVEIEIKSYERLYRQYRDAGKHETAKRIGKAIWLHLHICVDHGRYCFMHTTGRQGLEGGDYVDTLHDVYICEFCGQPDELPEGEL